MRTLKIKIGGTDISLVHALVGAMYHPLRLKHMASCRMGISTKASLRVLMYHDIGPDEMDKFATQLRFLSRSWRFVSVEHFENMIQGDAPIRGRNLLLTFDDGFISNRSVADTILKTMGIRALFFIPTDFIGMTNDDAAHPSIYRRFFPNEDSVSRPRSLRFMSWNDIEALLENGHVIGSHSRRHTPLSEVTGLHDLTEEIVSSANDLESKLGVKIQHFSYPFSSLESFSPEALKLAGQRYKFIHTGLRGDNFHGVSPWAVRRDAVAPRNSLNLVGSLLLGGADFRYARSARKLDAWCSELTGELGSCEH